MVRRKAPRAGVSSVAVGFEREQTASESGLHERTGFYGLKERLSADHTTLEPVQDLADALPSGHPGAGRGTPPGVPTCSSQAT